jgi:uncharacterized protein YcfJ
MNDHQNPKDRTEINPLSAMFYVSSLYAYATTNEITGLKGPVQAAFIGGGTTISACAGFIAGGIIGTKVMEERHKKELYSGITSNIDRGATMWALTSALLAAPTGYAITKDIIVGDSEPASTSISVKSEEVVVPQIPAYAIEPIEP